MLKRRIHFDVQALVLFGIMVVIIIISSILSPKFFTFVNIQNITQTVSLVMLVGSAAVMLMIAGNFDLSVGSVMALSAIMFAFMCKHGIPTYFAMVLAIGIGAFFGLINGFLVNKLRVGSIIATLATLNIAKGLAWIVARYDGGARIASGLPSNFQDLGRTMIGPVPLFLIVVIAIVAVMYFVYSKTLLSKYAFAIGGNETAAKLSGVRSELVITVLFVLVGALVALAGIILSTRLGSATPNFGPTFHFDVIIAIVLGGTSIYGGEGSFAGMIIGALIVGMLANIMNLMDINYFYQLIVRGIVLIGAVLANREIKERLGR
jgi:ribose transport system permease protein